MGKWINQRSDAHSSGCCPFPWQLEKCYYLRYDHIYRILVILLLVIFPAALAPPQPEVLTPGTMNP